MLDVNHIGPVLLHILRRCRVLRCQEKQQLLLVQMTACDAWPSLAYIGACGTWCCYPCYQQLFLPAAFLIMEGQL